jgi:hypothetical protein
MIEDDGVYMERNTVKLIYSKITKQARKYLTSKKNDLWDLYDIGITLDLRTAFYPALTLCVMRYTKNK